MEYEKFLAENESIMVKSLQDLLKIRSEREATVICEDGQEYPFGKGVQEAFEMVLHLGEEMGFQTKNVDNYGGHIDFIGTGEPITSEDGKQIGVKEPKIFGILGHLDVVPAGGGWSVDPYGGEMKDGYLYGRGTTDDKGPLISCLYGMKALKDAGFQPRHTIRLILGLDEETGWDGMDYYFKKVEKPDFGFTPDANFPIINGEMGNLIFEIAKKFGKPSTKGLVLRSIKGGTAPNAVPDFCRAVLNHPDGNYEKVKEQIQKFREETGCKVNCKGIGKSLEITTTGIAAHGARPELGLNAISTMLDVLSKINFSNEEQNEFIDFYQKHIGHCLNGELLGIDLYDEPSGPLIFNVGMIDLDGEIGRLTINVRYPVTCTEAQVYDGMQEVLTRYNFGRITLKHHLPIFMDLDHPMVKTLVNIYRSHTGDTESQPLVIGGGTYARAAANVIAFGALFPEDENLMHQKDEKISLKRLHQMTRIYTEAIYKLASE